MGQNKKKSSKSRSKKPFNKKEAQNEKVPSPKDEEVAKADVGGKSIEKPSKSVDPPNGQIVYNSKETETPNKLIESKNQETLNETNEINGKEIETGNEVAETSSENSNPIEDTPIVIGNSKAPREQSINATIIIQKQSSKDNSVATKDNSVATKDNSVATKDNSVATNDNSVATKDNSVAKKDNSVATKDNSVATKDNSVATKDNPVATKDNSVATKDKLLTSKEKSLATKKIEVPYIPEVIKHPLENTWGFWLFTNENRKNWAENQKELTMFDTVEDYWCLYHHMKMPSELKQGQDYAVFKRGISPMWEDVANRVGGRWVIIVDRKDLDSVWGDVVLLLIGENFENSNFICGAVVNVRPKNNRVCIWTRSKDESLNMEIGRKVKEMLRINSKLQFLDHKGNNIFYHA